MQIRLFLYLENYFTLYSIVNKYGNIVVISIIALHICEN